MTSEKILVINKNLLYWYNELDNNLEINSPNFPKYVLSKIKLFGEFEIDYIDARIVKLISKPKENTER
ncbi:hypothetical protein SAMN04487897_10120 [Paenibacillus sp. yr247]|uniref:hypothetical protein n=1 Tax=Paenibacillus sp. yr247 TaxID=1761880 RepID=UPI00087F7C3B|nr:hypothetical protein [Paenibacillus sp. yr247]SDM77762.1 hypothetical protein SAMN04487897_10120 [Paenibacillus sp. yr247]